MKNRVLLYYILLVTVGTNAFGQSNFNKLFNGIWEYPDINVGSQGSIFMYGAGTGVISKINSDGNIIWTKFFSPNIRRIYKVAEMSSKNLFVAFETYNTSDSSHVFAGILLADSNGVALWTKIDTTLTIPLSNMLAQDILIEEPAKVVWIISAWPEGRLIKIAENGNIVWERREQCCDKIKCLVDTEKNIYSVRGGGTNDLQKFDSTGQFSRARLYSLPGSESVSIDDVIKYKSGLAVGLTYSPQQWVMLFYPGIAKLDTAGNVLQSTAFIFPDSTACSNTHIVTTSDGGFLLLASCSGHSIIIKTDSSLTNVVAYKDNFSYCSLYNIATTSDSGFAIAGFLQDSLFNGNSLLIRVNSFNVFESCFDTLSVSPYPISMYGSIASHSPLSDPIDSFVNFSITDSSINFPFEVPCYTMGISSLKRNNELITFPNPSSGIFEIIFPDELRSEKGFATVYDNLGRIIVKFSIEPNAEKINLNLREVPKGIYCVSINNSERRYLSKVIVQ